MTAVRVSQTSRIHGRRQCQRCQKGYWHFWHFDVLALHVASPCYASPEFGSVPLLEAVTTIDEERERIALFAVNRGQDEALLLEGDLRAMPGYEIVEHLVLEHDDPKAINTPARPHEVWPHSRGDATLRDGLLTARLPKLSWNVIRLRTKSGCGSLR